jgi:quaternary ammonium compound-resistance protein SugE
MAWISIIIAAFCETFWASSLKFLDFKNIKLKFKNDGFFSIKFAKAFIPLCTYILFGILNMVFLTFALKTIPLAICYAVWMGVGLIIQALVDILFFKEKITLIQIGFLTLILIGVIGIQMEIGK